MRKLYHTGLLLFTISFVLADCSTSYAQAGWTTMPYRYKEGNEIIVEEHQFDNTAYYPTIGTYCTEDHRDPDGNKYEHSHLPHHFPFEDLERYNFDTQEFNQVTVAKSDAAWQEHYVGYAQMTGSTFTGNCFAHAASAPTVMFKPGWEAFTIPSYACDISLQRKSMGDASHVIKILDAVEYVNAETTFCGISWTSEKNASSGVFTKVWPMPAGLGTSGEVRRNK